MTGSRQQADIVLERNWLLYIWIHRQWEERDTWARLEFLEPQFHPSLAPPVSHFLQQHYHTCSKEAIPPNSSQVMLLSNDYTFKYMSLGEPFLFKTSHALVFSIESFCRSPLVLWFTNGVRNSPVEDLFYIINANPICWLCHFPAKHYASRVFPQAQALPGRHCPHHLLRLCPFSTVTLSAYRAPDLCRQCSRFPCSGAPTGIENTTPRLASQHSLLLVLDSLVLPEFLDWLFLFTLGFLFFKYDIASFISEKKYYKLPAERRS